MKKKGFIILAAIMMVSAVLAGCGGGNKQGEEPTEGQGSNQDKAFTIRVGSWFIDERPHQQAFKKAVEEQYRKLYPRAEIQWDITLGETFATKLKAQFASESAPDVTFYQSLDYIKAGYLMDLSEEQWTDRLISTADQDTTTTMYEGKRYGVPMQGSTGGGVWYNKKLFAELGLEKPANVDDFFEISEKIKQAGKIPIALGFKDGWTAQLFMFNWLQSYTFPANEAYGRELYDGKIAFDDQAIQTVFTHFQHMKENGYFNKNALSIDWPQSSQLFSSGEAAMIVQGPWMPGTNADNIEKGGYEPFEIGFFPLMDGEGKFAMQLGAGTGLAINAKTKLVEEAKALLDVMTSADVLAPWLEGEGSLSYFKDVEVAYADPVMEEVKQYVDQGLTLSYRLDNFMPPSAMNAMVTVLTKVVSGVSFNPDDLAAAQSAFTSDKSTVVLP